MLLSFALATTLLFAPTAEVTNAYDRLQTPKLSARENRNMAVVAELGWNSIAGLGVSYTYYVHPQIAIDTGGGFGFSRALLRAGGRLRYNLLRSNLTPYVALGATLVPGGRFDVDSRRGSFIARWVENVVLPRAGDCGCGESGSARDASRGVTCLVDATTDAVPGLG